MEQDQERSGRSVIGGVDTHKDLHVAAVVDEHDRVLGRRCFPTTRHGYKQMLTRGRRLPEPRDPSQNASEKPGAVH